MRSPRLVRTAILTAFLALLLSAAAQAETITSVMNAQGGRTYTYTDDPGDADSFQLSFSDPVYIFRLFGGDTFAPADVPAGQCTLAAANTEAHCQESAFPDNDDQLTVNLADGDDFGQAFNSGATAVTVRVNFRGGAGDDSIYSGAGDDDLDGGDGDDYLNGREGGDNLRGGNGADSLQGDVGRDDVRGDGGLDIATYSEKIAAQPVDVTLDDAANDGFGTELDNIHADVEDLRGGQGNDRLVGNDGDNSLFGGLGNDVLIGLGGFDLFSGEDGDDQVQARDGLAERINCGAGNDTAITDTTDSVQCESNQASAELLADSDGDGVSKPTDCNDGNPAIRPGAQEILDNGIDEDCNGSDGVNTDRDADGVTRPLDCNDTLATIRPGLRELLGNRVDENCDGIASPFPRLDPGVANSWAFNRRFTRVTTLAVVDVPAGATVTSSCKGTGCPRGTARTRVRRKTDELNLQRRFRGRRLRPGAVVEIRITAPESIGKVVRYTVRRNAIPRRTLLCMTPGATRPTARC